MAICEQLYMINLKTYTRRYEPQAEACISKALKWPIVLEPPVRLATDSFDREQSFTVALGLLNYVINHRAFYRGSAMKERSALGFLEKIKQIFKEYF